MSFVGNLLHLGYLGLGNTRYGGELPLETGKLHLLQTLDLFGAGIKELPSSIVWLKQVMFLILRDICLPNGLRNLTSLEELKYGIVDSGDIAEDRGGSTTGAEGTPPPPPNRSHAYGAPLGPLEILAMGARLGRVAG